MPYLDWHQEPHVHALQIVHRPEVFVVPSAAFGMGSTSRAIIAHVPNADASFSSLYVEEPNSRKVSKQPLCAPSIQCCWQCCLCCSLLKVSRLHSRLQAICVNKRCASFSKTVSEKPPHGECCRVGTVSLLSSRMCRTDFQRAQ